MKLPDYIQQRARNLCALRNAHADVLQLNAGEPCLRGDERWNVTQSIDAAITADIARLEEKIVAARRIHARLVTGNSPLPNEVSR